MKNKEAAMQIFELVRSGGKLPARLDDLVPLSFIGQGAVSYYREKIKVMSQLNMAEEQRRATLRDGQDAGEMLLDIEVRIGELALKEPGNGKVGRPKKNSTSGSNLRKPDRLGMSSKKIKQAQTLAKNPKIVAETKARARANEDIPTKTAALTAIKLDKVRDKAFELEKPYQKDDIDTFTKRKVLKPITQLHFGLDKITGNCHFLSNLSKKLLKDALDELIVDVETVRKELV